MPMVNRGSASMSRDLSSRNKHMQTLGDPSTIKRTNLESIINLWFRSFQPCSENSECLNWLLLCECRPSTCPAGEKCRNQRFQKRNYPKLRVTRTDSRGKVNCFGLNADIKC